MIKENNLIFSQAEQRVREEILALIKQGLSQEIDPDLIPFDYPPESKMGDYSVPCFLLAKKLRQKPGEIASRLAGLIKPTELIFDIKFSGPYLNFFVNQSNFSKLVLTEVSKAKEKYGSSKIGKGKKVMVEYFSPNTNKPLTIGHVRNICLGASIAKLLKFTGHKVIESTLYNDRGAAIAKAILGYQKWGLGQTPKEAGLKPDHLVGNFYTQFYRAEKTDKNLEAEAKKILQAWEEDKKEVRQTWQQLTGWVLEGFKETLNKLGVKGFNEEYYESEYYNQGKEVVEKGLKKGVFVKNQEGVVLAPLEKFGLPDKIVLRPDDTSLYITQDLYLAYLKNKHNLNSSVYVVGAEQDLYFKQLFKILELLGFENAKDYYHLSYGMIRLASGKIKSREGLIKGTGADELIAELEDLAKLEVKKRNDLSEEEINKRAEQIALAALKFYILVVNPKTTMVFDPKKSLAFTGRTGPYLQYVFARINSIFSKAGVKPTTRVDFSVLTEPLEFELVKILARFPKVIFDSVKKYDPADLANYLYDLAKTFSLFYEKLPVLKANTKVKKARLLLINDVKVVLAKGLELLGIPAPEKM
ncbi:MAG: arginine--tRNA ligase [Patescibacteria group bacterium]|jgi:arginyl-tRNA synthetase